MRRLVRRSGASTAVVVEQTSEYALTKEIVSLVDQHAVRQSISLPDQGDLRKLANSPEGSLAGHTVRAEVVQIVSVRANRRTP
jgi:hypothetical protein